MNDMAIIAVDLGGTKIRLGKVKQSMVTQIVTRPVPKTDQPDDVTNEIIGGIESIFDKDVAAIGIGVPSVVDVEKGIVYDVTNIPSWKEVHLKEILENKFKVPVLVNNDANCFGVGEAHFGKGQKFRNIVAMILGTGLGCGIIIDRRLYSGTNCGAGEIGTIPYKGYTVEYFCSGQFFTRELGVSGEIASQRAVEKDSAALRTFEEFGKELAHAMMTVLYAYDPEIVILGGSVSKSFSFFERTMWEQLNANFAYQTALKRLVIDVSDLSDSALLGAAALYLDAMEKHDTSR